MHLYQMLALPRTNHSIEYAGSETASSLPGILLYRWQFPFPLLYHLSDSLDTSLYIVLLADTDGFITAHLHYAYSLPLVQLSWSASSGACA